MFLSGLQHKSQMYTTALQFLQNRKSNSYMIKLLKWVCSTLIFITQVTSTAIGAARLIKLYLNTMRSYN
jgi:hypothetical protein